MDSLADQYGHDDRLFLSDVPEYLRCSVCSLVLRDPVQIISCGHKHCKVCFTRMKDRAQSTASDMLCPVDREVVDMEDVRPDVAMKRVIGDLQVKCREHENGCTWTGDLRDLDIHQQKCKRREPKLAIFANTGHILKKLNERLEECEASLFDKDKEIALLRYNLQQQEVKQQEEKRQLKEEIMLLRHDLQQQEKWRHEQQQQQKEHEQRQRQEEQDLPQLKSEVTFLKEKNITLELEMNLLKSSINTLNVKMEEEKASKEPCATPDINENNGNSSKNKLMAQKKIPLKHHTGERNSIAISEDFHRVVFTEFSTASAPSAVVPPGTRVWYEVHFVPGATGLAQQIGWGTANLPTSEKHTGQGVGDEKDSYGFNPFNGQIWHGGSTTWGRTFQREEGGYVGVGLDTVKGEVLFSVNGDWITPLGVAFSGIHRDTQLFPALSGYNITLEINFGDRDFKYGPPTSNFKSVIESLL